MESPTMTNEDGRPDEVHATRWLTFTPGTVAPSPGTPALSPGDQRPGCTAPHGSLRRGRPAPRRWRLGIDFHHVVLGSKCGIFLL
jgi:hypothetical protein